jgi:hypothetical protein
MSRKQFSRDMTSARFCAMDNPQWPWTARWRHYIMVYTNMLRHPNLRSLVPDDFIGIGNRLPRAELTVDA